MCRGRQVGIVKSRADFDTIVSAEAGFNIKKGDIIKILLLMIQTIILD